MTNVEPKPQREAARAIVLTAQREVLLLCLRSPDSGQLFWITPGGGLEPGESVEECIRRELREEVGLELAPEGLGPLVLRRHHTFTWFGRRVIQSERLHIVHVAQKFEPRMSDSLESKVLERFHWWPLAELVATHEPVTPRSLASVVSLYLKDGAPLEPLEVEVRVDQ